MKKHWGDIMCNKALLLVSMLWLGLASGLAAEFAGIPNPAFLGTSAFETNAALLVGTNAAIQPESLRIELKQGRIQAVMAEYKSAASSSEVKRAVSLHLKSEPKQAGGGVAVWRNEQKMVSAMLAEEKGTMSLMMRMIGAAKSGAVKHSAVETRPSTPK